jgi:hypothetical protein
MAEQDSTKREQAPGMNPDHTTKDIPVLRNPLPLGADEAAIEAGVPLEPELQAHIGRQLRAVYDGVVNEPVPDRFLKLLETLEREQAGSS